MALSSSAPIDAVSKLHSAAAVKVQAYIRGHSVRIKVAHELKKESDHGESEGKVVSANDSLLEHSGSWHGVGSTCPMLCAFALGEFRFHNIFFVVICKNNLSMV